MTDLTEFGSRLTLLCDGRTGLRGGLPVEVREAPASPSASGSVSESASPACLDFIASSETLDRYDEIISTDGWHLDHYRRNPVFQNAHQYGDILFTLGKALITEVRFVTGRPVLYQRIQFATEVNPMARIAYGLYKGRFLNAVSVGFIPLRWENADGTLHPSREAPRQLSTLDPQPSAAPCRRRYLEQELLEVSAVGIPANPDALQLALKAGAIQKPDLRDLADLFTALAAQPPECGRPRPQQDCSAGRFEIFQNSRTGEVAAPENRRAPEAGHRQFSLSSRQSLCSSPAAPTLPARASGVERNEAHWLRLARQVRRVLRNA